MVKANSAARRVFGQQAGENQGFHPAQLSPEYQPDGLLSQQKAEHMMTIAQARGSHRFEWTHLRGDGTPFFYRGDPDCRHHARQAHHPCRGA